jgi:DNA-binding HxlR family transcriptional regulator
MIGEVLKKHKELDDICHEIFFTLMAYKKLRFNELLRALKKLGIKITQPTLSEHLTHLIEKELIERKEEGFQNVSYRLTEEINSLLEVSQEDIEEWVKDLEKSGKPIPPITKIVTSMKSGVKNYYNNLSEEKIEKEIDRELNQVLKYFLDELKNYIQHDLRLDKQESA